MGHELLQAEFTSAPKQLSLHRMPSYCLLICFGILVCPLRRTLGIFVGVLFVWLLVAYLHVASFFFNKFIYFIYLFLAALGLLCCTRAFCSCGERGLLLVVESGLLIAVASLVAEHGL